MTIRVALVDDQALFRAGIAMVVGSQEDLEVVGEAGDGAEALALVEQCRPDVLLMDVRMPRLDGVQATRQIVSQPRRPGPPGARAHDLRPGRAGGRRHRRRRERFRAQGVATGNASRGDPGSGRRHPGGRGRRHAGRVRALPGPGGGAPGDEYARLTPREREVLLRAARGLSNAEIAAAEFLSEATVKTHMSRILTKLDLRDRVQLVVYAYEHGLI